MNKHALALAVGLAIMQPQAADALSLGDVQVESALSQPLRARIDLHDIAVNDLSDVSIRVASESLFQRMGMERSFALNNLKFDTVLYGDQPALLMHTRYPFNEPFLHVLLEVSHQNQVVLQEYTLMPNMPQAQVQTRADAGRRYVVKRGDTLFKIANRFRYSGANSNQMMLAILQRNPRAFVKGDGNRLKANVEIIIPARQAVNTVTRRDAQAFRGRLVKNNLSQKTLAKQPVAQPERSVEALSELEQARQHLKSLREKAHDVKTALQTSENNLQENADVSVSESTLRRLNAQLEVKDLKIAELQMRLARLNKKLLVEQEATKRPETVVSDVPTAKVFDATTLEQSSDFKPKLVIAPTSLAQHTIEMSGLPKAKAGAASPGDADEGTINAAAAHRQQTHKPVVITEVQQPIQQAQQSVQSQQPVAATKSVEPVAHEGSQIVPRATEEKAENVVALVTSETLSKPASLASIMPVKEEPSPVSLPDNEAEGLLAVLTSPLALYLELGAFFLLAAMWLYARHQRRKWRLVDDVVRDLEAKRAEQGREKLLWDKLVYAPDDWLIDLPESMESSDSLPQEQPKEKFTELPKEQLQLPDVEQLEALLKHDKMQVKAPIVSHKPDCVAPMSLDAGMPESTQEQADGNAVPAPVNPLVHDQVETLRRQIEEMQQMLMSLQQHRSYLENQRDAA